VSGAVAIEETSVQGQKRFHWYTFAMCQRAATTDDVHQLGDEPIDESGRQNAVVCRFASLSDSSRLTSYDVRLSPPKPPALHIARSAC
jgi:hypothetical protein